MKYYDWNAQKNEFLKSERGVSFEEIQAAIESGKSLDNIAHPNQSRYPGQRVLIVEIQNYVFMVPFVEDEEKLFLKTIYPSRKFTKRYLKGKEEQ